MNNHKTQVLNHLSSVDGVVVRIAKFQGCTLLTLMPSFHILIVIALLITNSVKVLMGVVRSRLIWAVAGASPATGVGGFAYESNIQNSKYSILKFQNISLDKRGSCYYQ